MSLETIDTDTIGPNQALESIALPPHVGAPLGRLLDADRRLTDAADWIDAIAAVANDQPDEGFGEDDLCHASDGANEIAIDGDRLRFVCTVDPLVVPFLRNEPGTITASPPSGDDLVRIEMEPDGVNVEPDGAVLSLGVAAEDVADAPLTPAATYRNVCPYVQAFRSPADYRNWAADVDAATTSVPMTTGVTLAGRLATALFDGGEEGA